jgi:hypothetical protein
MGFVGGGTRQSEWEKSRGHIGESLDAVFVNVRENQSL